MNISFAEIEDFRTNIVMYIGIYMHSFNIFVEGLKDGKILHHLVSFFVNSTIKKQTLVWADANNDGGNDK